jgi:hypothetical protein
MAIVGVTHAMIVKYFGRGDRIVSFILYQEYVA